jgi:hypothetical protein
MSFMGAMSLMGAHNLVKVQTSMGAHASVRAIGSFVGAIGGLKEAIIGSMGAHGSMGAASWMGALLAQ